MSYKVTKTDHNLKINEDIIPNKELEDFDKTNIVADRGDSAKINFELDGWNNKNQKDDEYQKIIDNFIKQYLPDRGDTKKNTYRHNITKSNKLKEVTCTTHIDKSHKVNEKESENDILIIPETGERVCKTDLKSISKRLSDSSRRSEKYNVNNTLDKMQRGSISLRSKEESIFNVLNTKLAKNSDFININPYNDKRTRKESEKTKTDTDSQKDEQSPVKITCKFIDQLLNQAGVSTEFRQKNARLHNIGIYENNTTKKFSKNNVISSRLEETQPNTVKEVLKQRKDRLDSQKDRMVTDSNRMRVQMTPEEKKKIREKYTLKLMDYEKRENHISYKDKTASIEQIEVKPNKSSTESRKSDKKDRTRKPIIKTIRSKKDSTKIYKAVTFVDQKNVIPLKINIPEIKKKVSTVMNTARKTKIKHVVSKASIKEKNRKKDRKRRQRKNTLSPETSVVVGVSPPTEVAKWAPSCINELTKPYYEAWVNTTLAAIARDGDKDGLLEKEKLIHHFQRALERPETPELVYEDILDEKFTGRITIR